MRPQGYPQVYSVLNNYFGKHYAFFSLSVEELSHQAFSTAGKSSLEDGAFAMKNIDGRQLSIYSISRTRGQEVLL